MKKVVKFVFKGFRILMAFGINAFIAGFTVYVIAQIYKVFGWSLQSLTIATPAAIVLAMLAWAGMTVILDGFIATLQGKSFFS